MIHSMTAFASARGQSEVGRLSVDLRSVNSRFLDLHLRLPDDLRFIEGVVREQIEQRIVRGKLDVRLSFSRNSPTTMRALDPDQLRELAQQLAVAREIIPDIRAPRLHDVLMANEDEMSLDANAWTTLCRDVVNEALDGLSAARQREGQRMAAMILAYGDTMKSIVESLEEQLPVLLQTYQDKITDRLRDALESVSPEGFALISGEELSARIAQEASLFSLRHDVSEELSRLKAHLQELAHVLASNKKQNKAASFGKRLDFLCQEMNREANTLGSKAASLETTRAALDLKLLIEQIREQAQNIE